jgi:hypothetical protein
MKFMPQDLFELTALSFAKYKLLGDMKYQECKFLMLEIFENEYKGDVLWFSQAEEMVLDIHGLVNHVGVKAPFEYLHIAMEYRKKLDENFENKSVVKRVFGGTRFTKSHPSPNSRKEIAFVNISRLTVIMAANGHIQ